MREHVTNFDRFWNSTFGLPQQYLMRMLRVIQDDRVDLFSKRGLFDMSLIPVLGIFDGDRYDVGTQEKFDRTLGALGVKDNLGTKLAVEIATDPLTYLTGGMTALAKGAATVNKARNVGPLKRLAGVATGEMRVGEFKQALNNALKMEDGKILDTEQRRLVEEAFHSLAEADESKTLAEYMTVAGQREIRLGLPILDGYGAYIWKNDAYHGWTRFLLDKTKATPLTTGVAEATRGMVSGIPALNNALNGTADSWRAFRDGAAGAAEDLRAFRVEQDIGEATRALTPEARHAFLSMQERGADEVKRAFERALVAKDATAWGAVKMAFPDLKQSGAELWDTITGRAVTEAGIPTAETFGKEVDKFFAEYADTVASYQKGTATDVLTRTGKQQLEHIARGKAKLYKTGRVLGLAWRRVFISDAGSRHFLEAEKNFRTQSAFYQQAVEERTKIMVAARAAAAAEAGLSIDDFDLRVTKFQEAHALQDELQDRLLALEADPNSIEAAKSLEDYAARFINHFHNLRKIISGGNGNPFDTAILAAMEPVFKEGVRDTDTLRAVMDGLHQTVEKWAPDIGLTMDSYGSYQMLTGARRGRYLQYIPTRALLAEQRRLKRMLDKGHLPLPTKAAQSVIEDTPELRRLRDTWGLTPEQTVGTLRGVRETAKLRAKANETANKLLTLAPEADMAKVGLDEADTALAQTEQQFKQFLDTEDKTLTQQMEGLEILTTQVGEWKEEVSHIKEQLKATRAVGRRAGQMWNQALPKAAKELPPDMQKILGEFGAEHGLDYAAVRKALVEHTGGKKKTVAYMKDKGYVPLKGDALDALAERLSSAVDDAVETGGKADLEKFDLARRAIGAEARSTRRLAELLKVREAEIEEWAKHIPTLKEDIKALKQAIRDEAGARSGDVKDAAKAARAAKKMRAKISRDIEKVRGKVRQFSERAVTATAKAADEFGVSTEAVEGLAARLDSVRDSAALTLHARELKVIEALLDRRRTGKSTFTERPRGRTMKFPHAARRVQSLGVERDTAAALAEDLGLVGDQAQYLDVILSGGPATEMIDTGEAIHNALSLVVMAKELRRAASKGTTIAPDVHRAASQIIQRNSELMEGVFYGAAGEKGKAYLDALNETRRDIHSASAYSGLITAGSPVAYSPRIRGFKEAEVLDQLLNDREFYQIIDTAMPKLGPLLRRNRDGMTVQDLNTIYRATEAAGGPGARRWIAALDKVAEANGYSKGFAEYNEDSLLNLMNRFAQGERIKTTGDFVLRMMQKGMEDKGKLTLIGGRVIKIVTGAGSETPVGETLGFGKAVNRGREVSVPVEKRAITVPQLRGVAVLTGDNRKIFVSAETMAMHRASMLNLGHPDMEVFMRRRLETDPTRKAVFGISVDDPKAADTLTSATVEASAAFSHLAARGKITSESLINDIDTALSALKEGDLIAFGNRDVISNTLGTIKGQWANFHPLVNGYDTAHNFVKRLQTIYKPSFLVGNTISAYGQSLIAGASPGAAARGYWHAAAFMSDNAALSAQYDRFATLRSAGDNGVEGVLRRGTEFLRILRRNPELREVPWADEVAFRVGGQEFSFREMAPHLRDLLMPTSTREGLRGGARISGSLERLAEAPNKTAGILRKTDETLASAAEEVEVYNRLTTWFALVDDGMEMSRATDNALAAHVNYADLTNIERRHFKRLFGFYAWNRKMLPLLMKKFVDAPGTAAALAGAIRSDAIREDENGQLVVDAAGLRVAVDRLNPALDALRMVEVVGEMALTVPAKVGAGGEAFRQETVAGFSRPPFSAGGLSGIVLEGLTGTGTGTERMMEDATNTFWLSRFAFGELTGEGEKTATEVIMEALLPVKAGDGKSRANSVIASRARRVIGGLERRAEASDNLDYQTRVYEEIARLEEYAASLERY